jgi:peptide chain release factor subunit 1
MGNKKKQNIDSYRRYLLKKNLEILKNKTGFHTALISLFVPPNRKLHEAISYLKNEISESTNIKSKTNRKNVLDSISTLISKLRSIKKVPENGLILYSGQVPVNNSPGTERSEFYLIVPPEPITSFKYYCAAHFLLDPLLDMVKEKGSFGIINIENKEASVGWIRGTKLVVSKTFTSGIHSKHNAGGQSQRRLERLIEEGAQQFYIRVGEYANQVFLEFDDLEGIYVSGAGMTKEKFINKGVLDYRIKDKFLDFIDVSYSGEAGIRETVIKIQDRLQDLRYVQEKKLYTRFMESVVKDNGLTVYGPNETRKALEMGAVDTLLISEKLDLRMVTASCDSCDHQVDKIMKPRDVDSFTEKLRVSQCPECGKNRFKVKENIDFVEFLGQTAETQGTKLEILSKETEGGETMHTTFGGIAALLRYKF